MFPPSPERKERIVTIERNANLGVFDQSRIEKIARETQRRTQARKGNDFVVARSGLGVTLDDQNRLAITFRNGADHVVPLKRSALQQLANATRVPATFLSRLTDAGHHDLAAATLSELLTRETTTEGGKTRKQLIRSLDGEVDAFLSDSYRAIPNDAILAIALEEFEAAKVQVWDLRLTDTDFRVLAFAPHISGEITQDRKFSGMSRWEGKEGDVLNAGLRLTNSETGHARFTATSAILRRICCNFNVWADVVAKTHLGKKLEEGEQDFTSLETKALEDAALVSKLRDAIRGTFDEAKFRALIARVNETTTRELGEAPTQVVDAAIKLHGLGEARREAIIERLLRSGDKSQYGLVQAITSQVNPENAKDLADETRTTYEEAGGKILHLSERGWRDFLRLAYTPPKETEDKETQAVRRVGVGS